MTRIATVLLLGAFLLGCSPDNPVKTQSEFASLKQKFSLVAVEGMGEVPSLSSALEQGFLSALIQQGVKAVPVSVIIPEAATTDYDEKLSRLAAQGYEAYLELHYLEQRYGNGPATREAKGVMVDTRSGALVWVGKIAPGDGPQSLPGHQAAYRMGELAGGTLIGNKFLAPAMLGASSQP